MTKLDQIASEVEKHPPMTWEEDLNWLIARLREAEDIIQDYAAPFAIDWLAKMRE